MSALLTAKFWAMGGHGFYVWSAYGFCAAVMLALTVQSVASARAKRRRMQALEASRPGGRRARR